MSCSVVVGGDLLAVLAVFTKLIIGEGEVRNVAGLG
jgi:hypothetical protein